MGLVALLLTASLGIISATALAYYLLCIRSARAFFRDAEPLHPGFTPPISVMIPVRGIDHEALTNFESFCRQDYPAYEILFGVQDADDPVIVLVEQLRATFPGRAIQLVHCPRVFGHNAKVSNLMTMIARARYDIVLIVDSDIRVGRDYLRQIVAPMARDDVGLVTCPYRATAGRSWAARLEAVGISSDFIPGVLVARHLEGMRFALGASMLTRKSVVEAIGGLGELVDYLGDDFLLGNQISRHGYRVVLSRYVVEHVQPRESFAQMLGHQLRWARSTRYSRPAGYIGLIFTHGVPAALALLCLVQAPPAVMVLGALTLVARLWVAVMVGVRGLGDRALARHLWLVPVWDFLNLGVWCYSFFGNEIVWRGKRFRLAARGRLIPVPGDLGAHAPASLHRQRSQRLRSGPLV